jgi:hypothetical protein
MPLIILQLGEHMGATLDRKKFAQASSTSDPLTRVSVNGLKKAEHYLRNALGHAPSREELRHHLRSRAQA